MAYVLSHARAAHLHYGIAPGQDARGELVVSYIGIGPVTMEMQPTEGGVLREIHGIVVKEGWTGYAPVGADLRELDRVHFMGHNLEIIGVLPWPDHLEVLYEELGR